MHLFSELIGPVDPRSPAAADEAQPASSGQALHPTDQDPFVGTPALHPTDQDPSVGTPAPGRPAEWQRLHGSMREEITADKKKVRQ
jgi:hypothetical protein